MRSRVLVDANVLYSRCLTDWLSLAAIHGGMYTIMWTEDVLAEARYHLRKDNPQVSDGILTTRFDRIRQTFPDGRIAGYGIVDQGHPDPDDWHVVNAAIAGNVDYLVTSDKKFAASEHHPHVNQWRFEVHTPDSFLLLIDDSNAELIRRVAELQYDYWLTRQNPRPMSDTLVNAGAPGFAERIASYIHSR